jgi:Secretion system C-terminal sorting domain
MKHLFLLFVACLYALGIGAQCASPQSQIDLHANNIQARILNGGDLFTDFANGLFIPNPDPTGAPSPSTIFAAGLWMGGQDPAGNLKFAAVDYRNSGKTDYASGPLQADGTTSAFDCANWDRHFSVTDDEIAAFLSALPLTQAQAIAQFPGIMGWPGNGNSAFATIYGFQLPANNQLLAPYVDANNDGQYTPLAGDYPAVLLRGKAPFVPAQIVWSVFNDHRGNAPHPVSFGSTIQMEIQQTAWAFQCDLADPVVNNTIFVSHKMINRATENIDSFHIGMWIDFDLGCYADDYIGCDPSRNALYAYNQDAVDGNPGTFCNGVPTFGQTPPVQTVTFLKGDGFLPSGLDNFLVYNSGNLAATSSPTTPVEYYNNLTGTWRDGSPMTQGGTGYGGTVATSHLFSSNPNDANGWSMCTANLPPGDFRVLASQKIGLLQPGEVHEFNTAWATHFNIPLPCGLGNSLEQVDVLQELYTEGFTGLCSAVSKAPELPADSIDLFPNPTTGVAVLQYGDIRMDEVRVYDAAGRLIQVLNNLEKGNTTINMNDLPVGVYHLRLLSNAGQITKKLAVIR